MVALQQYAQSHDLPWPCLLIYHDHSLHRAAIHLSLCLVTGESAIQSTERGTEWEVSLSRQGTLTVDGLLSVKHLADRMTPSCHYYTKSSLICRGTTGYCEGIRDPGSGNHLLRISQLTVLNGFWQGILIPLVFHICSYSALVTSVSLRAKTACMIWFTSIFLNAATISLVTKLSYSCMALRALSGFETVDRRRVSQNPCQLCDLLGSDRLPLRVPSVRH